MKQAVWPTVGAPFGIYSDQGAIIKFNFTKWCQIAFCVSEFSLILDESEAIWPLIRQELLSD